MSKLQELVIGFDAIVGDTYANSWMQHFLRYFTTMVLSPNTNPDLRAITLCLICADHRIPPISPERTHEHQWGDPTLQSDISNFETHFANLLHAFSLKGMYVECNTMPTEWRGFGSRVRLQHALPLIFPMLSREKLLILDDHVSVSL